MKSTLRYGLFIIAMLVGCTGLDNLSRSNPKGWSETEAVMIMETDSTRPMRVYKINNPNDSVVLRTSSKEVKVDPEDPVLKAFINRLYRTVRDSLSMGVGIAAPQVGILKRIIWVQRFDKEGFPFEVYLNPEIIQYSAKKQTCLEGCLSIPNRRDTLNTRAYAILLEYDKMDQSHQVEMVEDFTAVIFQHEIDHLNGILYLDHLEKEIKSKPHN
ncbi:MAG: hypothetical protein DHS20C17_11250 [Cyclobacteriaceae bacterium]|nr:MAG: hypothetical protein DHS20C17_11250 [Cyclobacteriaceae bacterium]